MSESLLCVRIQYRSAKLPMSCKPCPPMGRHSLHTTKVGNATRYRRHIHHASLSLRLGRPMIPQQVLYGTFNSRSAQTASQLLSLALSSFEQTRRIKSGIILGFNLISYTVQ